MITHGSQVDDANDIGTAQRALAECAYFLRAVQAEHTHANAWHAWGVMEARLGNANVARDLYKRGVRRSPR